MTSPRSVLARVSAVSVLNPLGVSGLARTPFEPLTIVSLFTDVTIPFHSKAKVSDLFDLLAWQMLGTLLSASWKCGTLLEPDASEDWPLLPWTRASTDLPECTQISSSATFLSFRI